LELPRAHLPEIPFLLAVGETRRRPLASSHFVPSPVRVEDEGAYLPSIMNVTALKNGLQKYREPIKSVPEKELQFALEFISSRMAPFWGGNLEDNVTSYDDAVASLDFSKSPGYPWYFKYETKGEALYCIGDVIKALCLLVLQGIWVLMVFAMTLKDELRPRDRVLASKTRVFNGCDLVHLIVSKMMFQRQNDKLMNSIGRGHPSTIGIGVPGPHFVSTVLSLGQKVNDGDGDGCDARFNLSIARAIRDLRSQYLPSRYWQCVYILYNAVYAGVTCVLGVIYYLLHQKSGWENTGTDNVFQYWFAFVLVWRHLAPDMEFDEFIKLFLNGDDIIASTSEEYSFKQICDEMKFRYNVCIEADDWLPRPPTQIVFLSHHLRLRWTREYGDFIVAAGNYAKLRSSINWVRKETSRSMEENTLMHLLGIRICIWPWEHEFEELEEKIDAYLTSITRTRNIEGILRARITSQHIAHLHLRCEGSIFDPSMPYQVLKGFFPPDKVCAQL